MENDNTLNGRIAMFQCPGFIVSIESDDFSHALKVGASAGFAEPETRAIVNGGALTKRFGMSKNGIRHITYIWIGKAIPHTRALTSKTTSLEKMEVAADHMIDVITRK